LAGVFSMGVTAAVGGDIEERPRREGDSFRAKTKIRGIGFLSARERWVTGAVCGGPERKNKRLRSKRTRNGYV